MAYRPTKQPPITFETTLENARKWLNTIRYGESAIVVQLQDDCEYRVQEIIENPKILKKFLGPYYRKYLLKYVPLDQKNISNVLKEALIELCAERKLCEKENLNDLTLAKLLNYIAEKGYEVGLFVSLVRVFLKEPYLKSLFELEKILQKTKNLSVVLFSELNLTYGKYDMLINKCTLLFDNIIKYPIYSEEDAGQFIKYHHELWHMKLSKEKEKEIIAACGGYLWFISQAMRFFRDNPNGQIKDAFSHDLMIKKLELVWFKFTDEEKNIIRKTADQALDEDDKETPEYKYLADIRVLTESNERTGLSIPLFSLLLEREKRLKEIKAKKGLIYFSNQDISRQLTEKEREFLFILVKNPKKILSREKIALSLWGNNWQEKYSDWAIDRLACRVRKKLQDLGADSKLLKTAKRKGFSFG